jgi:hypothetical protein
VGILEGVGRLTKVLYIEVLHSFGSRSTIEPVASDNLKPRNVGEAAIPGSDIASDVASRPSILGDHA